MNSDDEKLLRVGRADQRLGLKLLHASVAPWIYIITSKIVKEFGTFFVQAVTSLAIPSCAGGLATGPHDTANLKLMSV